jgi:hypothetical protein
VRDERENKKTTKIATTTRRIKVQGEVKIQRKRKKVLRQR